jgi:hypothetical protein
VTEFVLVWDEGCTEGENLSPTMADIVERVSRLNGVDRTLVTLYRGEGHVVCGGSAETGLVVYATLDNTEFWQLADPGAPEGEVSVIAGGQAGKYHARHVVDLGRAISAVTSFFESGTLAPGLAWEVSK